VDSLVEIGLANALVAGVLALVALVVGRISRRPALIHALWLLVLIKLITPPVISLPLPWWQEVAVPVAPTDEPSPYESGSSELVVRAPTSGQPPAMVAPAIANPPTMRIQDLVARQSDPGATVKSAIPAVPPMPVSLPTPATSTPSPVMSPPATPPTVVKSVTLVTPTEDPEPAVAPAPSTPTALPDSHAFLALAGFVWIAGAIVWFLVALWRISCFQRLLRHARSAPADLQLQATTLAKQLGLSRNPPISVVPGPIPPLLWAVGSPAQLFFPQTLLPRLDEAGRSALLVHELAHLVRRDHWVRWLELLACGLYWWYPLAWLACLRLRAAEEECCDAWVVSELPGYGAVYAGALLETIDFLSNQPAALPPAASGFGRVHHLKRRLTMIVRGATPRGLSWAGKLLILALLLCLPLTPGRARPAAAPP